MTPAMTRIDDVLSEGLSLNADGLGRLTLAAALQGFPETAHGGGVLAALDLAAARWINPATTPRTISVRIQKTVPLATPLPLMAQGSPTGATLTLGDEGSPLAVALVKVTAPEPAPSWVGWGAPPEKGLNFPTARGCLACGSENPMGLRVQLRFDDRWVWSECRPPEVYRTSDGRIAPALHTVLLDEMAWWLGALASGEAGVTTDLAVTLYRPAQPWGEALLAIGPRDRVAVAGERGHFWKTESVVLASDGRLLASGVITFAGSRAYSRRLIPKLLTTNPPERLRPIFPRYVP